MVSPLSLLITATGKVPGTSSATSSWVSFLSHHCSVLSGVLASGEGYTVSTKWGYALVPALPELPAETCVQALVPATSVIHLLPSAFPSAYSVQASVPGVLAGSARTELVSVCLA